MDKQQLQAFAEKYTHADFDKIKFDWNGERGEDFSDGNYGFRMELCEYLTPLLPTTHLELVRDLYVELAKHAQESFSLYPKFYLFAQELLARGGTTYLLDYLDGAACSMDTHIASSRINISKTQAMEMLAYIDEVIKTETNRKKLAILHQIGRPRFQYHAQYAV